MLRFRLFGMPVTVRTSFLIIAALFGWSFMGNPEQAVAWVAILFVSILIHELGHAFTARMFGSEVAIELNGLGGLTRWNPPRGGITPGRRAVIAAAGSATGLVFGGMVYLVASQLDPQEALVRFIVSYTFYVNVIWGLVNWLPIRPLDGGHLLESLLDKLAPVRGDAIAKVIFVATAAGALVYAIWQRLTFITILAGWLLLSEFATGQGPRRPPAGIPTLSYDDIDDEAGDGADETPSVGPSDPTDG